MPICRGAWELGLLHSSYQAHESQLHRLLFLSLLISKTRLKQTTAPSDLVPGHFEEKSGKWSTMVGISSAQKTPQHLHKTFSIRKQEKESQNSFGKESQNSASHFASCKEFSALFPLYRQVLQPVLPGQHLPNNLPPTTSYPHYQKRSTQSSSPTPTLGKDWFPTAGATVWREVITSFQKSHRMLYPDYMTYFKYQEHCKPHQNTQARIWSKSEVPRRC